MSSLHADSSADKQERPAVAFRHDSNYLSVHGGAKVTFGSVDQPIQAPRSRRHDPSQPVLYSGGKPQHVEAYITFGTAVVPERPVEQLPRQQQAQLLPPQQQQQPPPPPQLQHQPQLHPQQPPPQPQQHHHHPHQVPHGATGPSSTSALANPPERATHDVTITGVADLPPSNANHRPPRSHQDQHSRPQHPPHGPGMDAPISIPVSHPTMPPPMSQLPPHSGPMGHQILTQGGRLPSNQNVLAFPSTMQQYGRSMIPAARPTPGQPQPMMHAAYPYPFPPQHHQQPYHALPRNGPRPQMGPQPPLQVTQSYSTSPGGTPQYMPPTGMYAPAGVGYLPMQNPFVPSLPYQPTPSPASQPKSSEFVLPRPSTIKVNDPVTGASVVFLNKNAAQQHQQQFPVEQPKSPVTPPANGGHRQTKALEIRKPPSKDASPAPPKTPAEEPSIPAPAASVAPALKAPEEKAEPATPQVKKTGEEKRHASPSRRETSPSLDPRPTHAESLPLEREPTPSRREPSPSQQEPSLSRQEPSQSRREPSPSRPEPSQSRREPSPSRPEPSQLRREPSPLRPEPSPLRPEPSPLRPEPSQSQREPSPSRPEPSQSWRELSPSRREPSPSREELATPQQEPSPSRRELSSSRREPSPSREEPAPSRRDPSPLRREPSPARPVAQTGKLEAPAVRAKSPVRAGPEPEKPNVARPTEAEAESISKPEAVPEETTSPAKTGKDLSAVLAEPAADAAIIDEAHAPEPSADKHEVVEAPSPRNAEGPAKENSQVAENATLEQKADELEDGKVCVDETSTAPPPSAAKEERTGRKGAPASIDVARARAGDIKKLESFDGVSYPDGIKNPRTPSTDDRRYRYDRDFLLQFMNICKDKPEGLKPMDALAGEDSGPPRLQPASRGKPPIGIPRAASGSSRISATFGTGQMGNFQVPASKSSEQRFAESSRAFASRGLPRASSSSNLLPPGPMPGPSFGRADDRRRGGPPSRIRDDRRTSSAARIPPSPAPTGLTIPRDQIQPLEKTENRWVAKFVDASSHGTIPIELLEKKVKGLLNKLTVEKFDRLAPQIMDHANRSESEKDGRSLTTVIRLIFEKATDEPAFSAMYARLCQTMQEKLSSDIVDVNVQKDGKAITGGNLFRKHLLNRCQEDFEKGWKVEDDNGEGQPKPAPSAPGSEILTDEYYAAQKKKRRGLGLIRFIGELFKLQMLTERIMHECIRRLLHTPEEEETESLCKLLTTVGKQLDYEKAQQFMNYYFQQLEGLAKNEELPSRIRYMVKDVLELRKNKWVPRMDASGPKTIAQIHQDAEKQKIEQAAATAEALRRSQSSGGRGMPGIGKQIRRDSKDGWQVIGGQPKRVDTSNFGKLTQISSSTSSRFTPGGVFAAGGSKGWKPEKKEESSPLARVNSSNAFSLLQADGDQTTGRRMSVDAQAGEADRPNVQVTAAKEVPAAPAKKSPAEEKKVIDSMMKEFWGVHDVKVVVEIVKEDVANPDAHVGIVRGFVEQVLEKKEADVEAVASVFSALLGDAVINREQVRDAFVEAVPLLEDTVCDAPKAPKFFKRLMEAAGLRADEVETTVLGGAVA